MYKELYDEKIYWIWLQHCLGFANNKIRTVVLLYKTAKKFYEAGVRNWWLCGCFTKKELSNFENYTLDDAKEIFERCKSLKQNVVTFEDQEYPERLRNIDAPPCVLYTRGSLMDIDGKIAVSVVGTRKSTAYGASMAFNISFDLAKKDVIIVSGGALGIDTEAHKGALQAQGKTIAVLGCGINTNYLMSNSWIRREIIKNGVVVSEYPPDYPSYAWNFPVRNRIISGLSLGTLVVEADEKSGSLITANLALEQNRDVFSVPGDARNASSTGTNALIKLGAIPVTCAEDILNEYEHLDFENISEKIGKTPNFQTNTIGSSVEQSTDDTKESSKGNSDLSNIIDNLSKNSKTLYYSLSNDPLHIDKLSEITKIKTSALLQSVTELELLGLITCHSGRRYSKNNN